MPKVLSTLDCWEEFSKTYPDPKPIQAFYAEDPTLTKIFNIVAIPNIFYEFETYPFDEKLSEFSTISSDERDHLYDAQIRETYKNNKRAIEWLDFLVALYELVGITVKYYSHLKNNSDVSGQELIKSAFFAFVGCFSIHKIAICENTKGERFERQLIGRINPIAWFEKIEVPGKVPKVIGRLHFRIKPTGESIQKLKDHFDAKSVINFKRFRPLTDDVTYGGFDDSLDNIRPDSTRVSEKFLVEFFYKGKRQDFFEYSIRKRYKKELKRTARDARDPVTKDEYLLFAEEELFRCIEEFDESEGKPPGHYFRASLKYARLNIYKSELTESFEHEGEIVGENETDRRDGILSDISKEVTSKPLEEPVDSLEKTALKD